MDVKSISARNKGQAGTHNSSGDQENQVSPTTTTGDRRCKRTQERTGPHNNNLVSRGFEGPTETSRAGNILLTTTARNTDGKRWTPDITPDKWEKKRECRRMTQGNRGREKPCGHGWRARGAKKPWKLWRQRSRTSKPTRSRCPNHCGKGQRSRTAR